MKSKKFINEVKNIVVEELEGLSLSDPSRLTWLRDENIIIRSDAELIKNKHVTIVTGGGSGHEPGFAGYVGKGFSTAAVCGEIFASPSASSVLAAIRRVSGPAGCLILIMNYTGDRLNFGLALERARLEGYKVSMLVVGDDCALPKTRGIAGRRGLAGGILVQKIVCAAAESGASLEKIMMLGQEAASIVGTIGIALTPCTLPGQLINDRLDGSTIEVGLGIHGEPGFKRQQIESADVLVKLMVDYIVDGCDGNPCVPFCEGDEVVVMINNLGGSSKLEELIIARGALKYIVEKKLKPVRIFCGRYLTSLDMCGISLSIMKISDTMLAQLDSPCDAPGWICGTCPDLMSLIPHQHKVNSSVELRNTEKLTSKEKITVESLKWSRTCIKTVSFALINYENILNEWDAICGDGDCGTTYARGAQAIIEKIDDIPVESVRSLFCWIANIAGSSMGGTSGALIEIFFNAAATAVHEGWVAALNSGIDSVRRYGGATDGMRTLLDALIPFANAFQAQKNENCLNDWDAFCFSLDAAREGAHSTKLMQPLAGRANYVETGDRLKDVPDPGAMAVVCILESIKSALIG